MLVVDAIGPELGIRIARTDGQFRELAGAVEYICLPTEQKLMLAHRQSRKRDRPNPRTTPHPRAAVSLARLAEERQLLIRNVRLL